MSFNDDGSEELPELKHQLQEGTRRVKDEIVENELRCGSGEGAGVRDGQNGTNGSQTGPQVPHQQQQAPPQGTMVCWERFLHLRSLKVLLVENDDSTRHVVTALLRNCSYEVIEATNGVQAWKILEDLTNHVDLVLTEVVMPTLSGIGLLCKIMSHKTRKNVPVIMMSSHDSMVLVFKCLSRGAVDFLVKPIRKNELKNLWQHVWRRCHSSSGSGSESGAQTQKSIKSKSNEEYDNAGSNDEEENGSIGLHVGDGSDNGSGTQSSWTKQAAEVESPRQLSSRDQMAECPDSTCARIVHPNAENCENQLVFAVARKECQEHKKQIAMGKDLEIGMPGKLKARLDYPSEVPNELSLTTKDNHVERGSSKCNEPFIKGRADFDCEKPFSQLKHESCTVTPVVTNMTDLQMDNITELHTPMRHTKVTDIKNKGIHDSDEMPSLGFGLKRPRESKSAGTSVQDDRNILRRSDSSAFSRYNAASNANKASTINMGSSFPRDCSTEFTKQESHNVRSQSSGNPPNHSSIGGSNNFNTDYRTNNGFSDHVSINKLGTISTAQQLHSVSAFHPVKNDFLCAPKQVITDNPDGERANLLVAQSNSANKEHHTQHVHIHYDNYQVHNHLVNRIQQQKPNDHNDFSLKKLASAAPGCGSSNFLCEPIEGNTGNSSINKSTSGSNHGSNAAINVAGTNLESDNGISGKSGSGDASGSGRDIENKYAHREAALTKFRQKRKERCFGKKVRYQSRKRLAEQRPRVRGQFVRQTPNETNDS